MDVRIGVKNTAKELEVLLAEDTDVDAVRAGIDKALADGGTLWLTDRRGRQYGVPADKLAYIEIGEPEMRRVGFGAL